MPVVGSSSHGPSIILGQIGAIPWLGFLLAAIDLQAAVAWRSQFPGSKLISSPGSSHWSRITSHYGNVRSRPNMNPFATLVAVALVVVLHSRLIINHHQPLKPITVPSYPQLMVALYTLLTTIDHHQPLKTITNHQRPSSCNHEPFITIVNHLQAVWWLAINSYAMPSLTNQQVGGKNCQDIPEETAGADDEEARLGW